MSIEWALGLLCLLCVASWIGQKYEEGYWEPQPPPEPAMSDLEHSVEDWDYLDALSYGLTPAEALASVKAMRKNR